MWVIVVSENKSESRNTILDGLLDNTVQENFLCKISDRWSMTSNIRFANIWKSESGPKRIIQMFEKEQINPSNTWNKWVSGGSKNKFYYIYNKHLHIRKVTQDEWFYIIDAELKMLKNKYQSQKNKLEKKRNQYGKK